LARPRRSGRLGQCEELRPHPEQRVARPRQIYIGPPRRDYRTMDERMGSPEIGSGRGHSRPPAGGRRGGVKRAGARLYAPRGPGGVVDRGKRVLLLLPTTTYRAHDFIRAAGRLGVETVVGSDRKQALQDLQPTRGVTLELRDPEKAAGQIADFDAKHHLNA